VQGMIWKDHLVQNHSNTTTSSSSNLRSFGWSILTAAYSPNFLYQNQQYLHQWVQSLCSSHTSDGILHLIEQTYDHENDIANPWSVENMIQQISSWLSSNNNDNPIHFRCMVGQYDVLALPEYVSEMARRLNNPTSIVVDDVVVVPNVGHAVPMEASRFWRKDVQSYFTG
jgi:pimeloyl-ACP methyl ester carboxylesterase